MDTRPSISTGRAGSRTTVPAFGALHHVEITVTDLARSAAWYRELLGMELLTEQRHRGGRVVLWRPGTAVVIGLDEHVAEAGEQFACRRAGLDHILMSVPSRGELDAWHAWLTSRGVCCSEVRDVTEPFPFAQVSFTDPDGVALELIHAPVPVR